MKLVQSLGRCRKLEHGHELVDDQRPQTFTALLIAKIVVEVKEVDEFLSFWDQALDPATDVCTTPRGDMTTS